MSLTKGEHVIRAYAALRISGLTTAANPEEVNLGLSELEDMMNEFRSRNICSSYVFEDDVDPNTDSEINDEFNNATQKCLAIRLAPYFGKEVSQSLMRQATQAVSNWSARSGKINMIQPSNRQARGSGNTFRNLSFNRFYRKADEAPISCDTFKLKVDEVDFFQVDFSEYLLDGAVIDSFTTDATNGVQLVDIAQDGDKFDMECKGLTVGYNFITITITTSTGRVNPQKVNFNIIE